MKLELLKLVLPGLQVRWRGKCLPRGDFKLNYSYRLSQSFKHSLSPLSTLNLWSTLSQSLKHSKLKHRNHWNARCQTFTVHGMQRNNPHHQILSPFLRPHSDDPLTHPLKSLKRSLSSACNEITVTVKRYPLSSNHIPTIPFPQTTFRRPYQRKFWFCSVWRYVFLKKIWAF